MTSREDRMNSLFVIQNEANVELGILQAAAVFDHLHRWNATLNRLNENECNYGLTPAEERKEERTKERATKYAAELGLTLDFNSDPRGSAIRIMTPKTKQYNSWGGAENGWYIV
jgi:hypothetical protein